MHSAQSPLRKLQVGPKASAARAGVHGHRNNQSFTLICKDQAKETCVLASVKTLRHHLRARFAVFVATPLLMIAIAVTVLAFLGLRSAAADSDRVSIARQTREVRLA